MASRFAKSGSKWFGGGYIAPIAAAASSADYTITSDADWTTVLALSNATLAGKVVEVAPGTYSAQSINKAPASTLLFRAQNSANKPLIVGSAYGMELNAASKISFENIKFASNRWDGTSGTAVQVTGANTTISFEDCEFLGNYRGTVGFAFDVTTELYPEYAAIAPIFNSSGVITGFTIERPYVGDLMADGTYNMIFNASVTGAAGTFTVSGGNITSTSLTTGGTSSWNDTTGIGELSKIISWTGQQRMIDYLAWGMKASGGGTIDGLTLTDNLVELVANGIKFECHNLVAKGNTLRKVYMDYFSFGVDQTSAPMELAWNFTTLPFSRSGDPGDPHADVVQFYTDDLTVPYTPADWSDIMVYGNIHTDGPARGSMQAMIFGDTPTGIYYSNAYIAGNFVASDGQLLGIAFDGMRDCYLWRNAIVRYDPTDTAVNTNAYTIRVPAVGASGAVGNSLVGRNIGESFSTNSDPEVDATTHANATLGLNGVTIPYTTVFNDPTLTRATIADVITAYTPEAAYAGYGPFGSLTYIDHVNRTIDRSLEPSWVKFTDQANVVVGSTVTQSTWQRIIGGPASQSISITNGEYSIADDAAGTNATAYTSASGTVARGKFIKVRHTASASGGTVVTTTLTLNTSYSFTFASTTVSASAFDAVDNGATARSSVTAVSADTGIRKFAMAVRFRADVLTAGANILADAAASAFRLWPPTTSTIRAQFFLSTRVHLRPTFTQVTGSMKTHIITFDLTNTNASQGVYWATIEDGVLLNNAPGTGGTFDTRTTAGSGTDYGSYAPNASGAASALFGSAGDLGVFGEPDAGGLLFDGAIEMLWIDWGTAAYTIPDITNSAVRNLWTAGSIGADGSGPTGAQPKLYYTGPAADWNAGLANKGSLTKTLTKQAGTYT